MPVTTLPIATGFYQSKVLPLSAQVGINCYPHLTQASGLSAESVFSTPGLSQSATSGASVSEANRGARVFNSRPYFVNGTALYRLETDNTLTNLGSIEGSKRVSMADNGTQLMVLVPGGKAYIFTASPDSLVEITDSDFTANGAPQYVVFIDSYFLCVTDDKKFIISAPNDGTSWDALDFGSAESSPDGVVFPVVLRNQLYICGERTIEGFSNTTAGADFPFTRNGLFVDKGVSAPLSVINSNNSFLFIGAGQDEGPAVWLMQGNYPEKVSTDAVDVVLGALTDEELSVVHAWAYGADGHYFVGFSLPTTSLVYDLAAGRWHERKSRIANADETYTIETYRVSDIVQVGGTLYAGDLRDGRVGTLSDDTYDEYDERVIRQFATQPFQSNMQPFTVPKIELTVESGVGNASEPDPQVRLEISRDGGKTWSEERARSMGKVGEYNRRAIWRRNGRSARFDVYRFTTAAPVKFSGLQLTAQIESMADAA